MTSRRVNSQSRLPRNARLVCLFALLMAAAVASRGSHLTALRIVAPALASTAVAPATGGPVATLSGTINLLENTRAIIKLDGTDSTPGATMTGMLIYVSNAGRFYQVNPDGTRGALFPGDGQVTGILGAPATNPDRLVWYEPNPDFFGTDGFEYYLKDNLGGQSFLQTLTLSTHHVNQAPRVVSTTHYGVATASITGIVLNVLDPDPLSQGTGRITQFPNAGKLYTSVTLSPQTQLTPSNPTFSGIQLYYTLDNYPNPGTDAFSYVFSDGMLSSPVTTDFIDIQLVSAPPTPGGTLPRVATIENNPLQITLTPVDPLGATSSLQITPTSLPVHGTLCQDNLLGPCQQPVFTGNPLIKLDTAGTSWVMTYTPDAGFTTNGTPDTFSYELTNPQDISSGPFTIQIYVLGPANPPGCTGITISPGTVPDGNLNSPYAGVTFTASGGSGRVDFVVNGTLPAGMTFSGGKLSGTPTQSGNFPFFVLADDSGDCAQIAAYDLTIQNPPPGISAQGPVSVKADGTVSLMPVAVVSDPFVVPGSLTVQALGVPAGITVAGFKNLNGVVTAYVGAACNLSPQMYSATLQVSDGVNPVTTALTINVSAPSVPGPPLAYPAQVKIAPGQSATVRPVTPVPAGAAISRVSVFNSGIGGYDGTVSADAAGNVILTRVGPSGSSFTVAVTVLMGCSVTRDSTFTVVTPTYDKCLKDDSSGNFIQFNSQTGNYLLTVCGAAASSFSGTGTVRLSGSVLMITDIQADRRVTISYLTNQLTGNATITMAVAPGVFNTIRIVQRNINATCGCS